MGKHKLQIIIMGIILVLVLRTFSLKIALITQGYDIRFTETIEYSLDYKNNEMTVLRTKSDQSDIVLVMLTKNKFGFWSLESCDESSSTNQIISLGWFEPAEVRVFGMNNYTLQHEIHTIYAGNNAQKLIELDDGQLPENVLLSINQSNEKYTIYVTRYIGSGESNDFNPIDLLIQNKIILN
jgi:hypothetical protein